MKFTCINIQGNLISEEVLTKVGEATAAHQTPKDFGLEQQSNLRDEIEYAWSRIKLDWRHFLDKAADLPSSDPYGTTMTRKWMEQFFSSLGYEFDKHRANLFGDNKQEYNISHTAKTNDGMPVSMVGFYDPNAPEKNTLDIKSSGGTSRLSPHGTVQEYLNVTGHVYGFATNGMTLRLIRDSGRLVKLSYIEFDLRRLLDEDKFSEFTVLYRLIHSSRFPNKKEETGQSPIEKYYLESIETGNRIRDGLSLAVKESMVALGNGFLQHPDNDTLRESLRSKRLSTKQYYDQLRRLVYRLLFLMVTEERDLVYDPDDKSEKTAKLKNIYLKYYSIGRLRKLSQKRYLYEKQYTDVWQGLMNTFLLFEEGSKGQKLAIKPLAGDLFSSRAIADIEPCTISNDLLLECLRNLNEFQDKDSKALVPINYRALDVEELGSVYEGLLELHPVIEYLESTNPANIRFTFHGGTERKTTGSYYTRPDLVNELIKAALMPVIEERLKACGDNKEKKINALLQLKVCDAAAGSGHMVLAAARTIGWYLAKTETGEENPPPAVYRHWLREAIQHCVYAVDLNPDAVELCKLSLWLEGHNSGKPLSFLDHKIKHGNSLVGVTDLSVLKEGIPDGAFNPITGDDKAVCQAMKKANKEFNKKKQITLDFAGAAEDWKSEQKLFAKEFSELEEINQDTLDAVKLVAKKHHTIRSGAKLHKDICACDLYTAAFFHEYKRIDDIQAPSSQRLKTYLNSFGSEEASAVSHAEGLKVKHHFFHWPLEFPAVFEQGGFDVMLGNPPWEIIELKEQEFFVGKDSAIAGAENKASRTKLIHKLENDNPTLYYDYLYASHTYDATRKFIQESNRFMMTAFGRVNTYSIFSELNSSLINKKGRMAIIVPTGIATDDGNKEFFGHMVENNRLISLFDFENREKIFKDVDSRYKFCLLTLSGSNIGGQQARFGFFLTRVEQLQDKLRIFGLSKEDFLRLNPNTKTCPIFRTRIDAELTTKIYRNVPILINEDTGENPWGVSFKQGLFNMSSDSHLFRTKAQLEEEGFSLFGNRMKKGDEVWLPLYEAKMIWHYDHRFGTYAGVKDRTSTQTPTPTLEQYQDPNYQIMPWYWVNESHVLKADRANWQIGFRRVARSNDERTFISCLIPLSAIGDSVFLISSQTTCYYKLILLGLLSSIPFDFITRQKFAGINANFFYVQQFPALHPNNIDHDIIESILPKVLELSYTSWDIKPFADDIWIEADADLKMAIQEQWQANKKATGGHEWGPPEWCSDYGLSQNEVEGCPLPPFKWDEERRAVLKAELDAIYAKLYGLTTEELRYILDPQDVYGPDFPGETFRVLKEKEIRLYGEYRTKRLVMEAWGKFQNSSM